MSWSAHYIGIEEIECHCWELARRVYSRELGVTLPSYDGSVVSVEERAEVEALISGEEPRWSKMLGLPQPFDILVFHRGGMRSHIGIVVDGRRMLHMRDHARIDHYTSGYWAPRLRGIYRHVEYPFNGAVG